jgi:hypothetical protein
VWSDSPQRARAAYFTCDTNATVEQPFSAPLLPQIYKM